MLIDQKRPGIYHIAISGYELAALIASARWVAEGAKGELSKEAIEQLRQVVSNYDEAQKNLEKKIA
jgi:hypothetical protein